MILKNSYVNQLYFGWDKGDLRSGILAFIANWRENPYQFSINSKVDFFI